MEDKNKELLNKMIEKDTKNLGIDDLKKLIEYISKIKKSPK